MDKDWIIFSLIIALTICVIVVASLIKCYFCKKLKVEENKRKNDEDIVLLLKDIDARYNQIEK